MGTESDAAESVLPRVRALAPLLEAAAPEIEANRRLTAAVLAALKGAGLFRLLVPRSLGGAELPLAAYAAVLEEVAKADASTAWCLSQNGGICREAAFLPRAAAREIFGDPDMAVAWGNGPASAIEVEGGFRLTGRWGFASGVHHATWLGCHECPVIAEDGQPKLDAGGAPRRCVLFFRPAAADVTDAWQVSGLCGTGTDTISVTDLFVPREYSGADAPFDDGTLYLFNNTNIFAVGFASVALGIARATLDAFRTLAITKTPRGISGVIREQPVAQVRLAESEAVLRSARTFLHQTVADVWEEASETKMLSLESRVLLRLATTYAIHRAAEVVDSAYYAAGATAIFNSEAFERRFRDMHAATQHIQAREDHYQSAGQYFFGLDPDRRWL
jgi:alkylation response protein AidB-like acyl-CoA dehydrogenase